MSMFGAVYLSTLAPHAKSMNPASGAAGSASRGASAPASGSAGSGLPVPLVVDVDASSLRDVAEVSTRVPVIVVLQHVPHAAYERMR